MPAWANKGRYEAFSLVPTVLPFLDGKSNTASWAQQVNERK